MTRILLLTAATVFCLWIFWRILNQSGGVSALFRAVWRFVGLAREEGLPPRRTRAVDRTVRRRQERHDALLALPAQEAAAQALRLLADGSLWRCGPPLEGRLPFTPGPLAYDLFARHARIESARRLAVLSPADASPFSLPALEVLSFGQSTESSGTYWRIGTDFTECPILMKPNSDEIIVVRRLTSSGGRFYTMEYPSLYHWLLIQHEEL